MNVIIGQQTAPPSPPHLLPVPMSSLVLMVFAFQDGRSPLWAASLAGHLDVLKTLIEAGANVNQTNKVCIPWHCCNCIIPETC